MSRYSRFLTLLAVTFALLLSSCSDAAVVTREPPQPSPGATPVALTAIPGAKFQNFAIYSDEGTWLESIASFAKFLDAEGIKHSEIKAADINLGRLDGFTGIYFPGGWSPDYNLAVTEIGMENIRTFVSKGGTFIGICAGGYFAAASNYTGLRFSSPSQAFNGRLKLIDWTAVGPMNGIAVYPDYAMTQINLEPLFQREGKERQVLYFGGSWFRQTATKQAVTVIARYKINNTPAIIEAKYGEGRVLLSGVHIEVDVSSITPAARLVRPVTTTLRKPLKDTDGSDWPLLGSLLDSLLALP